MATKKNKKTNKSGELPSSVALKGSGYTKPRAKLSSPRLAPRDGIFEVRFTKAKEKWFVPVKNKPNEWNVAFSIETTGPSAGDKGFKKDTYQNVTADYPSEGGWRPGQSRMHWVRDLMISSGMDVDKAERLCPVDGDANLGKLDKLLDKYVEGGIGYVKIRSSKERKKYQGKYHCSSQVAEVLYPDEAKAEIEAGAHEQIFGPEVQSYIKDGGKRADDDDDLEDEDVDDENEPEDEEEQELEDDEDEDEDEDDDDFDED